MYGLHVRTASLSLLRWGLLQEHLCMHHTSAWRFFCQPNLNERMHATHVTWRHMGNELFCMLKAAYVLFQTRFERSWALCTLDFQGDLCKPGGDSGVVRRAHVYCRKLETRLV